MENILNDLNKCENLMKCKGNKFAEDNFSSSTKLVTVDDSLDTLFLGDPIYWEHEGWYLLLT